MWVVKSRNLCLKSWLKFGVRAKSIYWKTEKGRSTNINPRERILLSPSLSWDNLRTQWWINGDSIVSLTCACIFLMVIFGRSSSNGASFLNHRIFVGGGSPTTSHRIWAMPPESFDMFVRVLTNFKVPLFVPDAASTSVLRKVIKRTLYSPRPREIQYTCTKRNRNARAISKKCLCLCRVSSACRYAQ